MVVSGPISASNKHTIACWKRPCRLEFGAGVIFGFCIATMLMLRFQCPASPSNSLYLHSDKDAVQTWKTTTAVDGIQAANSIILSDEFSGKRTCSIGLLKEFFDKYKQMPETGNWTQNADSHLGEEYRSEMCEFGDFDPIKCLLSKNITSIITIGDSQVWRYTDAMIELFNQVGGNCSKVRTARSRDAARIEYFQIRNWTINFFGKSTERPLPYTAECSFPGSHSLQIEFISIYFLIEPTILIKGLFPEPTAMSFHEFVFNHYLNGRKPDLLFLVPPFNHIKYAQNIKGSSFNGYLTDFIDLVFNTIPRQTSIYWLTTTAELEAARNQKSIVFHNARYEGMLATDKVYLMNRRLYEVLQPQLLDPSYNCHGFFNLHNMSSVRGDWGLDGVHLQPVWYNKTVEHIFSTICDT